MVAKRTGEEAEQIETRGIGPMEIIEQHDHRLRDQQGGEEILHLIEEFSLARHCPDGAAPLKGFRKRRDVAVG